MTAAGRTTADFTGDERYDIRILRDGTWLYGGTPITRHNLVKLFSTVLKRDPAGNYWLVTPYEQGRIAVDDAPFTAVEMKIETSEKGQALLFRTNVDDWVTAGAGHSLRLADDTVPYIHVRHGLEARVLRPVYYALADLALATPPQNGRRGVVSDGVFFPLGPAD